MAELGFRRLWRAGTAASDLLEQYYSSCVDSSMRIDAHQHFWRYNPDEYGWIDSSMGCLQRDFLHADLKPELKRAGFGGCIAVQARQTIEETRWLLELADSATFVLAVLGWVELRSTDVRSQLAGFAQHPKFRGVRRQGLCRPAESEGPRMGASDVEISAGAAAGEARRKMASHGAHFQVGVVCIALDRSLSLAASQQLQQRRACGSGPRGIVPTALSRRVLDMHCFVTPSRGQAGH